MPTILFRHDKAARNPLSQSEDSVAVLQLLGVCLDYRYSLQCSNHLPWSDVRVWTVPQPIGARLEPCDFLALLTHCSSLHIDGQDTKRGRPSHATIFVVILQAVGNESD